jgi:hypothetical protein
MVGIWVVGAEQAMVAFCHRNQRLHERMRGNTKVMAEIVIVLGIRNAVSQIIYKASGGDIRHRKEGRKEDQAGRQIRQQRNS